MLYYGIPPVLDDCGVRGVPLHLWGRGRDAGCEPGDVLVQEGTDLLQSQQSHSTVRVTAQSQSQHNHITVTVTVTAQSQQIPHSTDLFPAGKGPIPGVQHSHSTVTAQAQQC